MFSQEETRAIRAMLGRTDEPPLCPRCESELEVQGPSDVGPRFYIKCHSCRRAVFIGQDPGRG
jgi:transposase-like protein